MVVEHKPSGTFYLRSPHPLAEYPPNLTRRLDYWAAKAPDRILFAERESAGAWRSISYAQTLDQVRTLGQTLLDASSAWSVRVNQRSFSLDLLRAAYADPCRLNALIRNVLRILSAVQPNLSHVQPEGPCSFICRVLSPP